MVTALYDVIQTIIVMSLVSGSVSYLVVTLLPNSFKRYRYWIHVKLRLNQKNLPQSDITSEQKKSFCSHCSSCPGCPISTTRVSEPD